MRTNFLFFGTIASFALSAVASPEPCSDHPGVVHAWDSNVTNAIKLSLPDTKDSTTPAKPKSTPKKNAISHPWSKARVKKKAVPKVKSVTQQSLQSGAVDAITKFVDSGDYLPSGVSSALKAQIIKAIEEQLAGGRATQSPTPIIKSASKPTAKPNANVVTVVKTVTMTVDGVVEQVTLNIQKALQQAFAAANVSQSGLNAKTTASLEKCLSTVLANGGLPDGYSCITASGSDAAGLTATLNTILEQFVGILPNTILSSIFDAVTPHLTSLLPASEAALVNQIKASIQSVIATASGGSAAALQQVEQCYLEAMQQKGNTSALACITKQGGALSTMQAASNGVLEQFTGVLPAALMTQVQKIFTSNLAGAKTANATLANQVAKQISSAINSVQSSLSGNMVTLAESLQTCAQQLIATGDAEAAKKCITNSSKAPVSAMNSLLGIAQQFSGYLPSAFFTDLTQFSKQYTNTKANKHNLTQTELNAAFDKYFNSKTYGPAYVTCFSQVQNCVTKAMASTGDINAKCPGPIKGCTAIEASSTNRAKAKVAKTTTTKTTTQAKVTKAAATKATAAATKTTAAAKKTTVEAKTTTTAPRLVRSRRNFLNHRVMIDAIWARRRSMESRRATEETSEAEA